MAGGGDDRTASAVGRAPAAYTVPGEGGGAAASSRALAAKLQNLGAISIEMWAEILNAALVQQYVGTAAPASSYYSPD